MGVKPHAAGNLSVSLREPAASFGHGLRIFLKEILSECHSEHYHLRGDHSPSPQNFWCLPAREPYVLAQSYESLLQQCANEKSAHLGRRVHASMVENCQERDKLLCNLVLRMYGKCGSLLDALACFSSMHVRNVFSWAIMIHVLLECGHVHDVNFSFQQMLSEAVLPDKAVFVSILSACSSQNMYPAGQRMHASIIAAHCLHDVIVGTALLSMYCKCKRLENAQVIFVGMPVRNVVSWNAMISAYVDHDLTVSVPGLVAQMQTEGVFLDEATYVSILNACAVRGAVARGKQTHVSCLDARLASNLIVGTALISMYEKCGNLELAKTAFELLALQDVVSWTAMVSAIVRHGHSHDAMQLFFQMKLEGIIPNLTTASSMLDCCFFSDEGKRLHAYILGYDNLSDTATENSLLKMYGKCGDLLSVYRLFDRMVQRNVVSWTEMVKMSLEKEQGKNALNHFGQMLLECVLPDYIMLVSVLDACSSQKAIFQGKQLYSSIIGMELDTHPAISTALVNFYTRCSLLDEACQVVLQTSNYNLVSWSSLISVYAEHKSAKEVFHLFAQMEAEGVMPDRVCVICALDACACHAALAEGNKIHYRALDMGLERESVVGTALVTMYGKCGSLEDAQITFGRILERNEVTWNAMIGVHSQHGHIKESLSLYHQMQREGFMPDGTTYHCILSACRYGGLLDEGYHVFYSFLQVDNIKPTVEHFNSMVDLFTRAGLLDEGECVIKNMPYNPNGTSWMTLLGACEKQLDVFRGAGAAEHVLKLDPLHASPYVVLSNMYAAAHRWDDVLKVRNFMKEVIMSVEVCMGS